MFPGKKTLNKAFFTAIKNPTAADICQMHTNAIAAFPGEPIVAARLDIASAYNRIRVRPHDVPLGALLFESAQGDTYVAMPVVEWFGSQDSNFHFQMVEEDHMSLEHIGASVTTMLYSRECTPTTTLCLAALLAYVQ